ncbi:MAG: YggS family pyridoxal phosphate-dependent enzyme [Prevotellaceae bacterium]|jgi:pyridoxal phosphate enzyme (YggS family)|nr:YggS family pyridoxal phosphate-dependent enzyme [Prevotellaceae bacterium]
MSIAETIEHLRRRLPPQVGLVAVSKTHSVAAIMEAYRAGQRDFGESRPQELQQKAEALPRDIRWHFIGHLQRNKVKLVLPYAYLIHSAHSAPLLREIESAAQKQGATARCLLQLHVAQEEAKLGFAPDELPGYLQSGEPASLGHVQLCGLMAMATNTENAALVRGEFQLARRLHEQCKALAPNPTLFTQLSMGMSGDYPIAIEEGATLVRIGGLIFGSR